MQLYTSCRPQTTVLLIFTQNVYDTYMYVLYFVLKTTQLKQQLLQYVKY